MPQLRANPTHHRPFKIPFVLMFGLIVLMIGQYLFKPPLKLDVEYKIDPPIFCTHLEKTFKGSGLVCDPITEKLKDSDIVFILDQDITKTLATDQAIQYTAHPPWVKRRIQSGSGEHSVEFREDSISYPNEDGAVSTVYFQYDRIVLTGGYFTACLKNTFYSVLANNHRKALTIIFPMDLVYYTDSRTLLDQYNKNYGGKEKAFLKFIDEQYLTQSDKYKLFSKINGNNLVIICVANERIDR